MNKKLVAVVKRHFKERHVQATSQIPNLVKKLKQIDGFWNKVKVILKTIPENIKESIQLVKQQNRELHEIRRSRRKSKPIVEPSDEIVILGMRIRFNQPVLSKTDL